MIAARRGVPCCERPEAETPQTRTIHDGPLARDLKLIKHALMVVEMNAVVHVPRSFSRCYASFLGRAFPLGCDSLFFLYQWRNLFTNIHFFSQQTQHLITY